MDIVRAAIQRPVTVAVGVLLVVMFGLISLTRIPIQLTPAVDRPIITVSTSWPGRSPQEVVDEITQEQEKHLKNVGNLLSMRSTTREGSTEITLEFTLGADISRALQEVSDALRQVPAYPDEVDQPVVKAAEGASENAIAWIIIDLPPERADLHPGFDITTLYDALDREVKPFLERIDGVAQVNIYGGREREVRVLLDAPALAVRGLTHGRVIDALRAANRNVSAGSIAEGKRDYRIRVIGQFASTEDILATIVAYRDGKPVYIRDVGTAEMGHQKQRGFVRSLGSPCIAMNVIRQGGSNVMQIMDELHLRLDEVRAEVLPRLHPAAGADLRLRQVYDETIYIRSAIDLVISNLWRGGIIAAIVLLVFLRSFRATGIIAVSIPISVVGTFLVMAAAGRSLNVISLAGLAFATGMVVDNAVVILENIHRRLQAGDRPLQAAYRGGREVWAAVLASTLTTVAVFIPILTIQEEAGQLFRDIALAIAVSVSLSLLISITVIPAAAAIFLRHSPDPARAPRLTRITSLFGLAPLLRRATDRFGDLIYWLMTGWRGWSIRPALILFITLASLLLSYSLVPPMDYLPRGNRNLVFGGLLIPPGYSIDQQQIVAERIEQQLLPYVRADIRDRSAVAALPPIFRFDAPDKPFDPIPVDNFFIGAFGGGMFIGATSQDPVKVIPVGSLITGAMNTIPDAFGFAGQASIFGRGAGGGSTVNVEISGPRLPRVAAAADMVKSLADQTFGRGRATPFPSNYNLAQPEARIVLNDIGRELGLTTRDVGIAARALFDGAFVDYFRIGAQTVDLVLLPRGGRLEAREALASIPIWTPSGRIVPLDTVVGIIPGLAPQDIHRIEEWPAIAIRITPPEGQTVEEVIQLVQAQIMPRVREAGLIDPSMRIRFEGTAAKLAEVSQSLFGSRASGADPVRPAAPWRRAMAIVSILLAIAGAGGGVYALIRAFRRRRADFAYAALGLTLLGLVLAGVLGGIAWQPQLAGARFVWALAVTYLLMCSLYEDFLYPLVIMFSVPLAVVGGFAGLAIVHRITGADPTQPTQQLDVLTMLGFVILIGTVVNNSILIVQQALNFMRPSPFGDQPLPPLAAIAQSVRTRVRPIFMTTLTTTGGMAPLVLAPGAGSEMYRGLGAVVLGGLLVSMFFTLILVPLLFSLAVQMRRGVRLLRGHSPDETPASADHAEPPASVPTVLPSRRPLEPVA